MNCILLGDTTWRNKMLKLFMAKLTKVMRDKSEKEKETIAKTLYEKYEKMTLEQIRCSHK